MPGAELSTRQLAMVDVRCKGCKRLLMRVETEKARIETVCPDRHCRRYHTYDVTSAPDSRILRTSVE